MESAGFKEWSLVCDALGRGRQSVILRKGGIAEGRGGFSFRHREFFLFPTFFHEQIAKVRIAAADIPVPGSTVAIRWYARVERAVRINSLAIAEALAPLHILSPELTDSADNLEQFFRLRILMFGAAIELQIVEMPIVAGFGQQFGVR